MSLDEGQTADLVALICWLARERDTSPTTVQLVKYLYLADLYNARRNSGETLTGWPWAFVYFGPYCSEAITAIEDAASRGLIARDPYESRYEDKDFFLHRPRTEEEPPIADRIPLGVLSGLKFALRKWADDTAGLLDYVYFDTEPMKGVQPGARLSFASAKVPESIVTMLPPQKLSTKKEKALKEIVARLRNRTFSADQITPLDTGPHDALYGEATGVDEEDGGIESGFRARVSISDLDGGDVDE